MTQIKEKTLSLRYVDAMGHGWNLGNSFDSFHKEEDKEELSWGNPRVTKELLQTVKKKGFKNIRLPLTVHMRIDGPENDFTINESFLNRYEEAVKESLEEGFYVMINIHHDSVTWLKEWNGQNDSDRYKKYVRIWEQLSERFKDYDERVMFESINEPQFDVEESVGIQYLEKLNDTFYHIVRQSGGNNGTRMLVLPTLLTNDSQNKLDALYEQIVGFDDPYILATVHYYSVWVYSANIGKTRFDQTLWEDVTPRTSLVEVFDRVTETFIDKGIGVVIGEYGLLGYDKSESANQFGETLKYLEYINYYANKKGMSLILWDNGQHLNRYEYEWYLPRFGEIIERSMKERSAYSKGLDTEYLTDPLPEEGLAIPLVLNGHILEEVRTHSRELIKGKEYTLEGEALHLSESFFKQLYEETLGEIGLTVTLILTFSGGADWYHHLIYSDKPVLKETVGKVGAAVQIPTVFNGNHLESLMVKDSNNESVANNKELEYLQHSLEFKPAEESIYLLPDFTSQLQDGDYTIHVTFFSGMRVLYQLHVKNGEIKGK
ncbi:cellulase family glycosylhydrolase [Alkalibacterium iburiense]|uniref:Cellulase family glycosylhydrolase n=1 Tax=Alkalibacterium iburiense TaxID=290589 RepID=A0ABN0X3A2_9LACT